MLVKNNLPNIGISLNIKILNFLKPADADKGGVENVLNITWHRYIVNPPANTFKEVPDIVWSARKWIDAIACILIYKLPIIEATINANHLPLGNWFVSNANFLAIEV